MQSVFPLRLVLEPPSRYFRTNFVIEISNTKAEQMMEFLCQACQQITDIRKQQAQTARVRFVFGLGRRIPRGDLRRYIGSSAKRATRKLFSLFTVGYVIPRGYHE